MNEHKHEHLAGERPGSHTNQTILMVVFFVVWIIDSFLLRYTTFLFGTFSIWLNIIPAIVILALAVYFMDASHKDLFDTQTEGLATGGVFGRVRNPMYLGTVLFYFGLTLATLSLVTVGVLFIICIYYNMLANYEEDKLFEKFGEAFLEYKKTVRKWVPL
jgi:protein-S-isoprenylcysteine O-methyltransferase Ste14